MNNKKRPSWDDIWMNVAITISKRSIDPRHQVGAIIVSQDNTQVLAVGYNGNYRGGPNRVESSEPGKSGTIHAELNCLIKLDYNHHKKRTLYVTMQPCRDCSKSIVNANIDRIVYMDPYRDASGLEILKDAGIEIEKFIPESN